MGATKSRALVVDACVAQSAGEANNPESAQCRDLLNKMFIICHSLVMTPAIFEEWDCHARKYARIWWADMAKRRKVLESEGADIGNPSLSSVASEDEIVALHKDLPYVRAACAADGIIFTRDDKAIRLWRKFGHLFAVPKPIRWINPVHEGTDSLREL